MPGPFRNAFGHLLPGTDPAKLSFEERVDCLRVLSGWLQTEEKLPYCAQEAAWLGRCLTALLATDGAQLEQLLGVKAKRGSHNTLQRIARRHRR
jgi:hypothetical protein